MAFAGGLGAFLGGQGQEKARQTEAAQASHAEDARLAAQLAQSQTQFDAQQVGANEDRTMRAAQIQADTNAQTQQTKIANRAAGLDEQGNPIAAPASLAALANPKSTLDQKADALNAAAAAYLAKGATTLASQYAAQAKSVSEEAEKAKASALAFQKEADVKAKNDAQINHWSRQDTERAAHDNAVVAAQIRNGQLRYDSAMAGVGARYAAISAAATRQKAALQDRDQQGALNRQTRVDTTNALEQGRDDRFNAGQQNSTMPKARYAPLQPGQPLPSGLPTPVPVAPTTVGGAAPVGRAAGGASRPPAGVPPNATPNKDANSGVIYWKSGGKVWNAQGQRVDPKTGKVIAAAIPGRTPVVATIGAAGDEDDDDDEDEDGA